MITLDQCDKVFETNANMTGLQRFSFVKKATNPEGTSIYMYRREKLDGALFGFEVFFPKKLVAGTVYKFPNGKTQTVNEDTEVYPNGAKTDFGKRAWFCSTQATADKRFTELMSLGAPVDDDETEEIEAPVVVEKRAGRGRPRVERAPLKFPKGEFSVKELAALNNVDYPVVFPTVKEMVAAGTLKETRTERRAARGPETQLYSKSN